MKRIIWLIVWLVLLILLVGCIVMYNKSTVTEDGTLVKAEDKEDILLEGWEQ